MNANNEYPTQDDNQNSGPVDVANLTMEQLLDMQLDQPLETKRTPAPAQDYEIQVMDYELRTTQPKEANQIPRKILRVNMGILLTPELQAMGFEKPIKAPLDIFLDFDENGRLSTGKNQNVALGRLFEACGVNEAGAKLPQLIGAVLIAKVEHRADSRDASMMYEEIKAVRRL